MHIQQRRGQRKASRLQAAAPGQQQQQQQRKEYRCRACGDGVLLMLTPTETLQHRRSHTSMANRPRAQ